VPGTPTLLRRRGRRGFRRLVYLSAIAVVLFAPAAGAVSQQITITPDIAGTLGANDWYTTNVTVRWKFQPEPLETRGCDIRTLTVDTVGTPLSCSATLDLVTWVRVERWFKIDKTVPAVATALERHPDANGWYNHPLTVAFTGTDATSGIASCTSSRYAGPDSPVASVGGSCSDNAGNVAPASYAFKYDGTPPSLFAVTAKLGNRSAEVAWRKSNDTQLIEVTRAPGRNGQGETVVYRGGETGFRDAGLLVGRKYEYRVAGVDEAANRAEHKLDVIATGALLSPAPAAIVTSPPYLTWTPVKGATHYNLQLIFRGRKVLSAWPSRPGFRLRRTWIYNGRRYQLRPGVYRWYVWPGYRGKSGLRYGRLLGSSTFAVKK
jgi:hypothetical protein